MTYLTLKSHGKTKKNPEYYQIYLENTRYNFKIFKSLYIYSQTFAIQNYFCIYLDYPIKIFTIFNKYKVSIFFLTIRLQCKKNAYFRILLII